MITRQHGHHKNENASASEMVAVETHSGEIFAEVDAEKRRKPSAVTWFIAIFVVIAVVVVWTTTKGSLQQQVKSELLVQGYSQDLEVHEGPRFFEGDILDPSIPMLRRFFGDNVARWYATKNHMNFDKIKVRADAIRIDKYLWPGGRVPFEFSANFPFKDNVLDAMKIITQNIPGVSFIEASNDELPWLLKQQRVVIYDFKMCAATLGFEAASKKSRFLLLSPRCPVMSIVHELVHVLGFFHEQGRPDRDQWVKILWDNIQPGNDHNFKLENKQAVVIPGSPYDFSSIMHYGATYFGKIVKNEQGKIVKQLVTVEKKVSSGGEIGQRVAMTHEDIYEVSQAYPTCTSVRITKLSHNSLQCQSTSTPMLITLKAETNICRISFKKNSQRTEKGHPGTIMLYTRKYGVQLFRVTIGRKGPLVFASQRAPLAQWIYITSSTSYNICDVLVSVKLPCKIQPQLTFKKPALQSSTFFLGVASRAVDGSSLTCSVTGWEDHPWWAVDLQDASSICSVIIRGPQNHIKLLDGFDIFVTQAKPSPGFRPKKEELCRRLPGATSAFKGSKEFHCVRPVTGRYVGVQIRHRTALAVCDFQVAKQIPV